MSHHQNRPEKIEKLVKIQTYHIGLFADFLNKLDTIPGRRRLAARSLDPSLRQQHEQQQRSRSLPAAEPRGRRRLRPPERRPAPDVRRTHADDEPARHAARQSRRAMSTSSATAPATSRKFEREDRGMKATLSAARAALVAAFVIAGGAHAATPPLVAAVKAGDRATALDLARDKSAVHAAEADGTTALHWAVRARRPRARRPSAPRRRRRRGREPLRRHAAASRRDQRQRRR